MKIQLALYGALREADASGRLELELPEAATVADLRQALSSYLQAHAPQIRPALVKRSAFASSEAILVETAPVPTDSDLAVLPPVSGG